MPRALVTGGGKRLGKALALDLGRRGFDVAVHFNGSEEEAVSVAEALVSMGRKSEIFRADFLDEAQVDGLVSKAAKALGGPLSVLVNNASIFERDTLDSMTRASWDRHIESNLRAPVVLTQEFAAQVPGPVQDENGEMLAQGCVINMLDQRVRKLTPDFMSYTIAKMGLWAFTRTAAQALAPRVRVNAIGPGPTLRGHSQSQNSFENQRQMTVLGRGPGESDITAAMGYLLDAPSVTGQLLCVDGGQHLAWQTPDIQDTDI